MAPGHPLDLDGGLELGMLRNILTSGVQPWYVKMETEKFRAWKTAIYQTPSVRIQSYPYTKLESIVLIMRGRDISPQPSATLSVFYIKIHPQL